MPIEWDKPDERYFSTGTDRGVIYRRDASGATPWNGLIGVTESGAGEATVLYRDGVIYHSEVDPGDYSGTVEAFFWPPEFEDLLGMPQSAPGLLTPNQKPKPFHLSYRSLVGNGTEGDKFGYQIHLFYNVTAKIGSRSRTTKTTDTELEKFSFELVGTPVKIPGFRPTTHFVIDTRYADPDMITTFEGLMYGYGLMPPIVDLWDMMKFGQSYIVTDFGDYAQVTGSRQYLFGNEDGSINIYGINAVDNGDGSYTLSDTPGGT